MLFSRVIPDRLLERVGANAPRRPWHRARAVPATGIPEKRSGRRSGTVISLAMHALLIFLLIRADQFRDTDPNLVEIEQGGGGPGPAGGGGGGTGGTGGVKFVQVAPAPTPAVQPPPVTPAPTIVPVIEPLKPVVQEPIVPDIPLPKLTTDSKLDMKVQSPIVGVGGGTGNDGTAGNGPGTGGGVGSGIGTGRGSGVGPGTGGGGLDYYTPTMKEMGLMPFPIPSKVKGMHLIAHFFIDERGAIDSLKFSPTKDGGYNSKLREMLLACKFRPATTLDGKPIKGVFLLTYQF